LERFVTGEVVVIVFPYSDLKTYKKRPAVVLAQGDFGDVVVCQITSFKDTSLNSVELNKGSFLEGSLPTKSYARPDKLFTADLTLVNKRIGKLNVSSIGKIKEKLTSIFEL
jgi:mRNA interferase MazF